MKNNCTPSRLYLYPLLLGSLFLAACSGSSGDNNSSASSHPNSSSSVSSSTSANATSSSSSASSAGATEVYIDTNSRLHIGDSSTFERAKFITVHASHTENDWWLGTNADSVGGNKLMPTFVDTYDVYFGRDTGNMAYQLGRLDESATKPGYASAAEAKTNGENTINWYQNRSDSRGQQQRDEQWRNTHMIVAAQQHPYWPDGQLTKKGWAFSQADTPSAPFGSATGNYMSLFLQDYFRQTKDQPGQPKPNYVEVMNEPLYDLVTAADTPVPPKKIFEFHNTVAKEIRKNNPDVEVGGYTTAFPDFDLDNFNRWKKRDKLFLDTAGNNMDFLSLHLYDFPVFTGGPGGALVQRYRKGSNLEATFDMLNQYTTMTEGKVKPLVISEYGAQTHALNNGPWTPYRDWLQLKSLSAMMMQFMQRADQIAMAIPFIVVKAEWGRKSPTVPYTPRLMRQQKEAQGETGDQWVYSDLVDFYKLWQNVNGKRLYTHASNLDLLTDAYRDGNTDYIALTNLKFSDQSVKLHLPEGLVATDINIKHLYLGDSDLPLRERAPVLSSKHLTQLPKTLTLKPEATMIIRFTVPAAARPPHVVNRAFFYATQYQQAIAADNKIVFNIPLAQPATHGTATLRLGVGRAHGKSLTPEVSFNGHPLAVPNNVRGDNQYLNGKGRTSFFGILEIPVPLTALEANNTINISFPDTGGYVSTAVLEQNAAQTTLF